MPSSHLKLLRFMLIVLLVLLFVQYEFGIATIIANPASVPPFDFSLTAVWSALQQAGAVATLHATIGIALIIAAIINLILALRASIRRVQVFGVLSFLSIAIAAGGGLFFVLSGFQDDNASHTMATNFMLAFTFAFIELYYTRSVVSQQNPTAKQPNN